ncbi:MAG: META domain-containing protein [Micropepsaceae bacterium]
MLIRHIAAAALAVTLAACAETGGAALPGASSAAPAVTDLKAALWPSAWVVTEIAGKPVVTGSEPTLTFDAAGWVSGNGTCNRYAGPSTIEGGALKFGALVSTKMACVGEGLNEQEFAYLTVLGAPEKTEITPAGTLEITSNGAVTRFRKTGP